MTIVEFDYQNFNDPCSEECIWAFQGSKRDFASGMLFWVKTLQAQGWEGRESYFEPYAEKGLCKTLSETEFAQLVDEYSDRLKLPLPSFIGQLDRFRSGLQMYAEWNDVVAIAELGESFVAFCWSTTA